MGAARGLTMGHTLRRTIGLLDLLGVGLLDLVGLLGARGLVLGAAKGLSIGQPLGWGVGLLVLMPLLGLLDLLGSLVSLGQRTPVLPSGERVGLGRLDLGRGLGSL